MQEVLTAGQLPVVEQDTELEMPTGFTKPSSDVLNLHPLLVPSPQDAEVRARGRTYQPVRVVFLANTNWQFAMLSQIEVPTSSVRMGSGDVECFWP